MVKVKTKEGLKLADEIRTAAKILARGGVVVFPTDTVYGVGCKFDDRLAVARIHKIKGTPTSQSMPILINNKTYLQKLGCRVTPAAEKLIKKFWPGALTLIFNSEFGLPAGKAGKIGLRIPNHLVTLALIREAGYPITGTSANFHGKPAPKKFEEVDKNLLKQIDFAIIGECTIGVESTVVDVTFNPPKVLRQGALKLGFR